MLVIGLGLSLGGYLFAKTAASERADNQQALATKAYKSVLEQFLEEEVSMLSAIGAFYRATNEVTRRDFHTFTNYLLGKSNFTQALEWIPRVPAVARTAMEAAARQRGSALGLS